MIDPEEFMLEEAENGRKQKTDLKRLALDLLGQASKFTAQAEFDPKAYRFQAGKAVGYYVAALKLAKLSGLDTGKYPVFRTIEAKLGRFAAMCEPPPASKTVEIQHRRDPKGVEVDEDRNALRKTIEETKEKVREEKKRITDDDIPQKKSLMIEDITKALKGLGFDRREAHTRALNAYRADAPLEEMIAEACR